MVQAGREGVHNMVNSSERKQALIGWSFNNAGFFSDTQLQKFLFFYELFSKTDGDSYELDGLKGYKNGPVFSGVFGDVRYNENFRAACGKMFSSRANMINEPRAKLADFLVKSLGSKLSEFTHMLNIWSVKQAEIESGGLQIPLCEGDFTEHDAAVFREIERAYPESYIDSVGTRGINGKTFVFFKADAERLSGTVMEALNEAAYDPDLDSPVYVSFSETGEPIFD
jgi:hypothetical protein